VNLKPKVIGGAVLLTAIPVLLTSLAVLTVATSESEVALETEAKNRLIAIRDVSRARISDYLETIRKQILTYSEDRMVVEAMKAFRSDFRIYRDQVPEDTAKLKADLATYYNREFSEEYAKRNPGEESPASQWLSRLDDESIALQYRYIKANSHPLGPKDKLDDPGDDSEYARHHRLYHPVVRSFLEKFGFYDIFLVDPETGDIVYSVFKELDFTTSLKNGSFASSGIGEVFNRANQATSADYVAVSDFASYGPSYQDPASFIASPVFDGSEKIGVLIF